MFRNFILTASAVCMTMSLSAYAEAAMWVNLKPASVSEQLLDIAKLYNVDIVFRNKDTANKTNGYVVGEYTTKEALEAVLSRAGLCFHQDRRGSYTIDVLSDERRKIAPSLVTVDSKKTAKRSTDNQTDTSHRAPLILDAILLKGSRLSNIRSLRHKRLSETITESVFSDELGQIPSNNIGESLNRLPGVSMLVEKGEGRYFQIRGINPTFNNITLNGADIGSPETEGGGRQAPLDMIAIGVVDGVVIRKVRTPDMDGQGIGGTLDIETKSPFDRSGNFEGQLSFKYGVEEMSALDNAYGGSDPFAVEGTMSGKSLDQKWGWLLAGAISHREYVASGVYQDDWAEYPIENGTGIGAIPQLIKNNYYVIGRKRQNLNSVLEYRPNDAHTFSLTGFWAQWDEFQHRNRFEEVLGSDIQFNTPQAGQVVDVAANVNLRLEEPEKRIFSLSGGAEHHFEDLLLNYSVNVNQNRISEPNVFWKFETLPILGPESFAINSSGIVHLTPDIDSLDRQSPSYYNFKNVERLESEMDEKSLTARFDIEHFIAPDNTLKFGMKYRSTRRDRDFSEPLYLPGSSALNLATAAAFTRGAFENCNESLCAPNILLDVDALEAFYADPSNASHFQLDQETSFRSEFASDYSINENVLAAYFMGRKSFSNVDLVAGLRVESTLFKAAGYQITQASAQRVERKARYLNWLPSLIATWNVQETLLIRTSLSRAIGRPDYKYIAPRMHFYEDEGDNVLQIGNPLLDARVSWNYDASIEWYPHELSLLYLTLFHKEISDDIVKVTQVIDDNEAIIAELSAHGLDTLTSNQIEGLSRLELRSFINAGKSQLTGIEVGLNASLDFAVPNYLSGFSVAANATILDGETFINGKSFPLLNQADQTYSLSLLYQNKNTDASISYAYNDSYLTRFDHDNSIENLSQGDFGRWDAKVSYTFNDNLKVFVEGVNLNNEPTTEFQGGHEDWNTEHEYVGRTIYVGFSYGF
ncbi:TonB-dependent receptor [Hirschia litorea]|uniref:TonB-dependent receptor n=1 Tax=Hirschia litorea TaxID=1199156 RepID=A0ABW2INP1_9PROT